MLVGIAGMLAVIDFVAGREVVKKVLGMTFETGFGRGLDMLMGRWRKFDLRRIVFEILAGTWLAWQTGYVDLLRTD